MASYDEVMTALRNADASGNVEDAQRLAQIASSMKQAPQSRAIGDILPNIGVNEAGLSAVTGAIAAPVAGIAGGVAAAIPGLREGIGRDVVEGVQGALTYQPRSEVGKKTLGVVAAPFELLAKGAEKAGTATLNATGSPLAATAVDTTINALPMAASALASKMGPVRQPAPSAVAARELGYALTPGDMKAGLLAKQASSLSGEPRLARAVSVKNQPVHNKLIAQDLKLPPDTVLDRAAIHSVRADAHVPYEAARKMGNVRMDPDFDMALTKISSEMSKAETAFPGRASPVTDLIDRLKKAKTADADGIVSEINLLRREATEAYANRRFELGKASKDAAAALENQLIRHAQRTGQPATMVAKMKEARTMIAKSYAAEKALVGENINPQVYLSELRKGKPLSGDALKVAEFAEQNPRSALNTKNIGETGATWFDMAAGGLSGEWKWALARPALRGLLSSDTGQGAMMNTPALLEAIRRGQASPAAGLLEMAQERKQQPKKDVPEPKRKPYQTALHGVRS